MVGFVMGAIISSVYEKIVSIAIQFVQKKELMTHYFVAQQEILNDATKLMIALSWIGRSSVHFMSQSFCWTVRCSRSKAFDIFRA